MNEIILEDIAYIEAMREAGKITKAQCYVLTVKLMGVFLYSPRALDDDVRRALNQAVGNGELKHKAGLPDEIAVYFLPGLEKVALEKRREIYAKLTEWITIPKETGAQIDKQTGVKP